MRDTPARRSFASFWIDESWTRGAEEAVFVMAGIKTRAADDLRRAVHAVREQHNHYKHELKFTKLSEGNYPVFRDIADALSKQNVRLVATVTDLRANNPFTGRHEWRAHADMAAKLLAGNLNKGEIGVAYLDLLNTPPGHSMGSAVKRKVNSTLDEQPLIDAVSLDSKCNDLLQVADAIAGAIRYEREGNTSNRWKTRFVRDLATAFDLRDLQDVRTENVNILTLHDRRRLKLVPRKSRVS